MVRLEDEGYLECWRAALQTIWGACSLLFWPDQGLQHRQVSLESLLRRLHSLPRECPRLAIWQIWYGSSDAPACYLQSLECLSGAQQVKRKARLCAVASASPPLVVGKIVHREDRHKEIVKLLLHRKVCVCSNPTRCFSSDRPAFRLRTSFLGNGSCRCRSSCITSVSPGLQGKHRQPDARATLQAEWRFLEKVMLSASLVFSRPIVSSLQVSRALHRSVSHTNIGLASATSTKSPYLAPLSTDRAASLKVMAAKVITSVHADNVHPETP